MKPKEIRRREILKTIALAPPTLVQAASLQNVGAIAQVSKIPGTAEPSWKPGFFTSTQNRLLETLSELIIPETETPGAAAALVNQHIDLVLSEETKEEQRTFVEGLNTIEQISKSQYDKPFSGLSQDQQVALLTRLSDDRQVRPEEERGRRFFLDLRRRTVFAYYTSRVGIHEELEYKGKQVLLEWEGCPHPGNHGDSG